jgi:hypothetical protein
MQPASHRKDRTTACYIRPHYFCVNGTDARRPIEYFATHSLRRISTAPAGSKATAAVQSLCKTSPTAGGTTDERH